VTVEILYEDDALVFINKAPHVVVQRSHDLVEPVLVEVLAETRTPLFLMQRLDRGTSGVMFFSKRADVNAKLTRQFETRRIRKRYVALCEGELGERQTIDAPLARIGPISFGVREAGKRAITDVEPIRFARQGSLVAVGLRTGRTHQIRVHLAAIGHPLIGDWLYGARNAARPMLHSSQLTMVHPLTNEPFTVRAPLPADFLEEAERRGLTIGEDDVTPPESS
jgi:23S rRNA pseudouridine1911/1915/1917 synthase